MSAAAGPGQSSPPEREQRAVRPERIPVLVGVAGHRDLVPEQCARIRAILEVLFQRIRGRFPQLEPVLLTSMADGADLLAAEVAERLGISIICVLPYSAPEVRADLPSETARRTFDRIYAGARHVEVGGDTDVLEDERLGAATQRDRQFQRAGAILARYSTLLVAVWDGIETSLDAGTAWVVEYRRRGVQPPAADSPALDGALLAASDNDLIYEIRCARRSTSNGAAGSTPVEDLGFRGTGVREPREWPRTLVAALERIGELNTEVARHAVRLERPEGAEHVRHGSEGIAHLAPLETLFRVVDALGEHYHRWFDLALRARYALWLAMAILLVSFKKNSLGPHGGAEIAGVIAAFVAGFLLSRWARWKSLHRKYLDYRVLAEALRVEFFWERAGVRRRARGELAHEAFLQRQDEKLDWILIVIRTVSLQLAARRTGIAAGGLDEAVRDWVGDANLKSGTGQLRYYHAMIWRYRRRLGFLHLIEVASLAGGFLLALAFFAERVLDSARFAPLPGNVRELLLWALTLLPAFAAIFDTYMHQKADRTLLRQYRHMFGLFTVAARELREARGDAQKRAILRSLGHACLAEHAQWVLAFRDKGIEALRW